MQYRVRPMSLLNQPISEDLIRSLPINKEILNERPNVFLHGQYTPMGSGRIRDMEIMDPQAPQVGGNVFKDISKGVKKGLKATGKFALKAGKALAHEVTENQLLSKSALALGAVAPFIPILGPAVVAPALASAGAFQQFGLGSQCGGSSEFTRDVLSPSADQESQIAMGPNSYRSATLEDALRDRTIQGVVPQ